MKCEKDNCIFHSERQSNGCIEYSNIEECKTFKGYTTISVKPVQTDNSLPLQHEKIVEEMTEATEALEELADNFMMMKKKGMMVTTSCVWAYIRELTDTMQACVTQLQIIEDKTGITIGEAWEAHDAKQRKRGYKDRDMKVESYVTTEKTCLNACDACDEVLPENIDEIPSLDDIANKCGYFSDTDEQNYGCTHPDNTKDPRCFSWKCPVAYQATCYRASSFDGDTPMILKPKEEQDEE